MTHIRDKETAFPLFLLLLCRIVQDSYQTGDKARFATNQGKAHPKTNVFPIFILRVNRQLWYFRNQLPQIIVVSDREQIKNTGIENLVRIDIQLLGCHFIDHDDLTPSIGRKHPICHIG